MRWLPTALSLTLIPFASVQARTWRVLPDGSGDAPTIQAAVDSAAALDVVELDDGVFVGPGNRDVYVGKPLTFQSRSGDPARCTVDCQGSAAEGHRGFALDSDCRFYGLTVTRGFVAGKGGAIYAADGVSAHVIDCVLSDNVATSSGGALAFDSLDLAGGGSRGLPEISVEKTAFLRNHAPDCGAVYFLAVRVDFLGCRFIANSADVAGGVTSFVHAGPAFVGCLFVDNSAVDLGGAVACGDPAIFESCTFVANAAPRGAHIASDNVKAPTTVANCILVLGKAGAAIDCSEPWHVSLTCSDVFANDGGDFVGCLEFQNGSDGNFSADPLFCNASGGDFRLRDDSPCAADNSGGCGWIGVAEVGCTQVAVGERSWGSIKARYR